MIGIGESIGYAVIIALSLLLYIPIVTTFALKEFGLCRKLNKPRRILVYIFFLILVAVLTLLIIRNFPYVSIVWLKIYAVLLTFILSIHIYNRKKKKM